MMEIKIEPLTEAQVRTMISWEYQEPYAIYNMAADDMEETVRFFLDPQNAYFAIVNDAGDLLGFCNFGADAQVPGGDYSEQAVDIGMGIQPDLTGKGHGHVYADAVFSFAAEQYPGMKQRVTIAAFNHRAQRLCTSLGFQAVSRFNKHGDERPFIIMVREPDLR